MGGLLPLAAPQMWQQEDTPSQTMQWSQRAQTLLSVPGRAWGSLWHPSQTLLYMLGMLMRPAQETQLILNKPLSAWMQLELTRMMHLLKHLRRRGRGPLRVYRMAVLIPSRQLLLR